MLPLLLITSAYTHTEAGLVVVVTYWGLVYHNQFVAHLSPPKGHARTACRKFQGVHHALSRATDLTADFVFGGGVPGHVGRAAI